MQSSNSAHNCWSSTFPNFNPVTPVLHLSGEYDSFTTPLLWKKIEGLLQGDGEGLILDASEVTFFDASAIRVLMMTAEKLSATSQKVTIRKPSDCVDRVLRICGLEGFFDPAPGPTDR